MKAKSSIRFCYYSVEPNAIIYNNMTMLQILEIKLKQNIIVEINISTLCHQLTRPWNNKWRKLFKYSLFYFKRYNINCILHIKNIIIDDYDILSNAVFEPESFNNNNFIQSIYITKTQTKSSMFHREFISKKGYILQDIFYRFVIYDEVLKLLKNAKQKIIIFNQFILDDKFCKFILSLSENIDIEIITNNNFTDFNSENFMDTVFNIYQKKYLEINQKKCHKILQKENIKLTYFNKQYIHANYIIIDNRICIITTFNFDYSCCNKSTRTIEQAFICMDNVIIKKVKQHIKYCLNNEINITV